MAASAWQVVPYSDSGARLLSSVAVPSQGPQSLFRLAEGERDGEGEGLAHIPLAPPISIHQWSPVVTWPYLDAEDTGKCSLCSGSGFTATTLSWGNACFGRLAFSATSSLKTSNLFPTVRVIYQMKPFLTPPVTGVPYCFVHNSALVLHCTYCIQHATGCVCWMRFSLLQRQPVMLENGGGSLCELERSLSFLAFSFLICDQARLCSDTPDHSPQVTVGLSALPSGSRRP